MDSDDEIGIDSGNVSSEEEDNYDFMEVDAAIQRSSSNNQNDPLEYPYEVLTTEEIVQHMLDCIKEVTNVVEVGINNMKNYYYCDSCQLKERKI